MSNVGEKNPTSIFMCIFMISPTWKMWKLHLIGTTTRCPSQLGTNASNYTSIKLHIIIQVVNSLEKKPATSHTYVYFLTRGKVRGRFIHS